MRVTCTVEYFRVWGIRTTYEKEIWIEDEFHPEGGYHVDLDQTYEHPKIGISCQLKTQEDLIIGAIYSDWSNNWRAIDKNTLINITTDFECLEIPEEIELISNSEKELKET